MREISNKKIVVRNAQKDEVFTTLDDQERKLDPEMLMITDGEKTLGIAGIMGGLDSGSRMIRKKSCLSQQYSTVKILERHLRS